MSEVPVDTPTPLLYLDSQPPDSNVYQETGNPPHPHPKSMETSKYRKLSPTEWRFFAHGVGGMRDKEQDAPVTPTNSLWPPKGLPPGLYRDIVHRRTICLYSFHFAAYVRWILLIFQLIIGAALTALGPMSLERGTPITILGASNTVLAGLLALFTRSGLPDRYRYDKAEFERVEDHVREILVTGLVSADKSVNEALAECYDLFQQAKTTVEVNVPTAYIQSQNVPQGQRMNQPGTPTQGKEPKDPITQPKTSLEKEPITSTQTQSRNTTPKEETEVKGPVTKTGE
ncbi:c6 transcription factor [Fusarium longipes]|uniref:C6 transcription factor n=1 Tax=Fusarium longipes TaxID=694270 RepID=A0A395SZG4_9HYPO|nr:c6 transcription factor [Fusarium longipes]